MAITKKNKTKENNRHRLYVEKLELLCTDDRNGKRCCHFGKESSFQKPNTELLYDPTIPLLDEAKGNVRHEKANFHVSDSTLMRS